jgi:cation:H+ antiporter
MITHLGIDRGSCSNERMFVTPFIVTLLGIVLLAKGAQVFVLRAAELARHWGMPALWVGILIFGFATSIPEMLVAGLAAAQGQAALALGSIVGSNIANIGLVLGVCALISPITTSKTVVRRELLGLCLVTVLVCGLATQGQWNAFDGIVLLLSLGFCLWFCRKKPKPAADCPAVKTAPQQIGRHCLLLVLSLVALCVGAEALVWGAQSLATIWHVEPLIIGLSIVAVGTSLPELATSLMSTWQGEPEYVLGNIVGSNLCNLTLVLAVPLCLGPITLPPSFLSRDIPGLAMATAALYLVTRHFGSRVPCIHRWEAGLLLMAYVGYIAFIYQPHGL